jgi:hypothetical protein
MLANSSPTIAEAIGRADLDSDQARSLVASIEGFMKAFQVVNFEERLRALEATQKEQHREAA